jgi:threonine synthase
MGYEIAEQLGWRIPAQVVIPMASGSLLTKVDKAFRELVAAGIVEDTGWTIFGAQSAGCDPIATAFDEGWDVIKPVKPTGIAKSLNIGNPADGPYALDAIRRTGGAVGRVGDDEIVRGIQDLARTTGIFAETAGGVTVAVLRQLVGDGRLDPAKETVVLNTGEGLKTLDPLEAVVGFTHRVEPSLRSVRAAGLIS